MRVHLRGVVIGVATVLAIALIVSVFNAMEDFGQSSVTRHALSAEADDDTDRLQDDVYKHIMELGILHNSPPSTKRGCCAGRLHRLWHGLPPAPWPCTRSQHHSVPSRNLHPLMVPPFLQPHPDLQSAVGNAPLSSKHPAQLPTTDCLLSIISPMGGQPSDAPALSPPSPLQQGGQSSNAPALSPPSPLPQGGQPIALALSPPSPPPQGGQPSDAPGLSPSSSTLLLCPSDSTLNICHLNSQSAVKTVCFPCHHQGLPVRGPREVPGERLVPGDQELARGVPELVQEALGGRGHVQEGQGHAQGDQGHAQVR
ncbi:hypothetical protein ACOMHN_065133 [Nucella lapillus]